MLQAQKTPLYNNSIPYSNNDVIPDINYKKKMNPGNYIHRILLIGSIKTVVTTKITYAGMS
jgi:hypothetical protein